MKKIIVLLALTVGCNILSAQIVITNPAILPGTENPVNNNAPTAENVGGNTAPTTEHTEIHNNPHTESAGNTNTQNTAGTVYNNRPMTAQDSLKKSIADFKTAMADVNKFFTKNIDTLSIGIADIDYDDNNLMLLKNALKKLNAVKWVRTEYNNSTAQLQIAHKGSPTDLWDKLPDNIKSAFKIASFKESNLVLIYKK